MDGKAASGLADGEARIEPCDFAKGGPCFSFEVFGVAIVGPKLAHKNGPRDKLRRLVFLYDYESAIAGP